MSFDTPASTRPAPDAPADPATGAGAAPAPAVDMAAKAEDAAAFLKALSHGGRLMMLCHLACGERSVGELETLLGIRQAAVSQQLARLRAEGLVTCRREGKVIHYSIADERVRRLVGVLHEMFCGAPCP